MDSIKIGVHRQMDGYNFSLSPTLRERIKSMFPNAYPANNIFVGYDTNSGFEENFGRIESLIYPALLGISGTADLKRIGSIEFIDSTTDQAILKR